MKIYRFRLEKSGNSILVMRVIDLEEDVWYKFDQENRDMTKHSELCELPSIKQAIASLKKNGKYRQTKTMLPEEIQSLYVDEFGNFVFNGTHLEEYSDPIDKSKTLNQTIGQKEDERDYINRIAELEKRLEEKDKLRLCDVEKKFVIEKFTAKLDAEDWIKSFLKECDRYRIVEDDKRIEALKLFLKDSALDWYHIRQKRFYNDDWEHWRLAFIKMFGAKTWSIVRQALSYRYVAGSLTDYALHKEKLLVETDDKMTDETMINLIVYNLPSSIQEKLERAKFKKIGDLYDELAKLNDLRSNVSNINDRQKKPERRQQQSIERKPCETCKELGFNDRFHPIEKCWNKGAKKPIDNKKTPISRENNSKHTNLNEVEQSVNQIMNINNNDSD